MGDISKYPELKDYDLVEVYKVCCLCGQELMYIFRRSEELEDLLHIYNGGMGTAYFYATIFRCNKKIASGHCDYNSKKLYNFYLKSLRDMPSFPEEEYQKLITLKRKEEEDELWIREKMEEAREEAEKRKYDFIEEAKDYISNHSFWGSIYESYGVTTMQDAILAQAAKMAFEHICYAEQKLLNDYTKKFKEQRQVCNDIVRKIYLDSLKDNES